MKRLISIAAAAAMAITLFAGCGGNSAEDPSNSGNKPIGTVNTASSDYVYVPEYISMPNGVSGVTEPQLIDGILYFIDNGQLLKMNPDGTGLTAIEGYKQPEVPETASEGVTWTVDRMVDAGGGAIWLYETGYFGYLDENDSYVDDTRLNLRKVSLADGSTLAEINLADITQGSGEGTNMPGGMGNIGSSMGGAAGRMISMLGSTLSGFRTDAEGNLYLAVSGTAYIVGADGTSKGTVDMPQNAQISDIISLPDGSVALMYRESGNNRGAVMGASFNMGGSGGSAIIRAIDPNTAKLGDIYCETSFVTNNMTFAGITGDGKSLMFYDTSALFSVDKNGMYSELINWLNSDIDSSAISVIGALNDSDVLCLSSPAASVFTSMTGGMGGRAATAIVSAFMGQSGDGSAPPELVKLVKTPASEVVRKIELTLAVNSLDYSLRSEILRFNKRDPKYRVKVIDYSVYNTTDDPSAGLTKLNTEIISGNIPDMILVDSLPLSVYAGRGLIEDLYPFLEADTELGGREAIVPAFLNALETNGKLYQISSGFTITTLVGDADVVGAADGWDMDELLAAIDANPEMSILGENQDRDQMMDTILEYNLSEYVDKTTGECNFNSPGFIQMLNFIKDNFSAEAGRDNMVGGRGMNSRDAVLNGTQMLYAASFYGFESVIEAGTIFGGNPAFKGFPCVSKQGNAFEPTLSLAMSSRCSDKEGAWSFMRGILTPEYQGENGRGFMSGFPSNQSVFEANAVSAMTESTESMFSMFIMGGGGGAVSDGGKDLDEDGNPDIYPKGVIPTQDGNMLYYYAMTQAEYDRFVGFINSITRIAEQDSEIVKITSDELSAFFNGQKSAEATAEVIQSRVSLYVNEQR